VIVQRPRAVFLDKDGTLVENIPHNVDPDRIALSRGAAEAVRTLAAHGFRLFVVSNQPGVALGLFEARQLDGVEQRLREMLPELSGFYYCPHAPDQGCECRKPACGLLQRAARRHGLRLERSWMVGDILDDIEAGRRAGCRTVLVDNGNESEWRRTPEREPHFTASDLSHAAALITRSLEPRHDRVAA
jgi:D-glycero-D-manno-heptose 1,7-bisphosphate phosphatase